MLRPPKFQNVNFKVLLLLAVYLFISLTNLFFITRHTTNFNERYIYIIKGKGKNIIRLQKVASITLSETKVSINRLVQNGAQFFILLLFTAGVLTANRKLFPSPNQFLPNHRQTYLRYCAIKI
jgi:hypothetical protein